MYTTRTYSRVIQAPSAVFFPTDPASNWVAAVVTNGGTVSSSRRALVRNLISGLQTDSVFTKLDRLWILAAENQPSALTDLIANKLATAVNSPTFTTDRGYQGDGATSYIDTNYNATTNAVNFAQNSASMGAWCNNSRTSGADVTVIGVQASVFNFIEPLTAGLQTSYALTSSLGAQSVGASDAQGFHLESRTASNLNTYYKNGSSVDTDVTHTADGVSNANVTILVRGSAFLHYDGVDQVSCGVLGGGLTGTDVSNLYTRLRTYMTAVGVP